MNTIEKFAHKEFIMQELEFSEVYCYLDKYVTKDVFKMYELVGASNVKKNQTIWVLWLQGMQNAPALVKRCFESICKNKPDNFDIILITENNLHKYITLPDFIWDKYNAGIITKTHLSDIIRIELLCTYGGCWIDSTVFCMETIPPFMLNGDMFLFKLAGVVANSVLKMSSWWLYAAQDNKIIHATRLALQEYWKNENDIKNYFLLHIIMSKLIDSDPACRAVFNSIPYYNSGNAHVLCGMLAEMYDPNMWEIIKYTSPVQKLSYKHRYLQGDIYNYYNAVLDHIC